MADCEVVYIFLDIDGVLRRLSSPEWKLDLDCRDKFEDVIRRFPEIAIVISSSWRIEFSLEEMQAYFSTDIATRIVGFTPEAERLTKHYRHNEVLLYLKNNGISHQKWIAVDDDPEHYPDSCAVALTDSFTGFDVETAKTLRGLFQRFGCKEITHCAAIPVFFGSGTAQFVLVTSKHQSKWTFPKGVIEFDMPIYGTALMEAFEEAGCKGEICAVPFGSYIERSGRREREVLIYVMRVADLLDKWEESAFRKRRLIADTELFGLLNQRDLKPVSERLADVLKNEDELDWLGYNYANRSSNGSLHENPSSST